MNTMRTICLPEMLMREFLVRFIFNRCSAQSAYSGEWAAKDVNQNLESIIASNDEMIDQLMQYFPSPEDRKALIEAVRERTGLDIKESFLIGEEGSVSVVRPGQGELLN